jgi:DNA-binding CsgD family transcriptional regulator
MKPTAALNTLGSSVVVISAVGIILRCEEASRARLTEYFGSTPGELLPDAVQRWVAERHAAGTRIKPLPGCLSRSGPGGTLTLRLAPLRLPEEWLLILSEAATQDLEAMLRPLGLSRRQSEVVRWLLEGKTNSEIGMILGISSRTVQKHLEHLFADLGVETRTAATARIRERLAATTSVGGDVAS